MVSSLLRHAWQKPGSGKSTPQTTFSQFPCQPAEKNPPKWSESQFCQNPVGFPWERLTEIADYFPSARSILLGVGHTSPLHLPSLSLGSRGGQRCWGAGKQQPPSSLVAPALCQIHPLGFAANPGGDRGCSGHLQGCSRVRSQPTPEAPQCLGSRGVSPGDGVSSWGPHNCLGTSLGPLGAVVAPLRRQKPPSRGRALNNRRAVGLEERDRGSCPGLRGCGESPTEPQPFSSSLTVSSSSPCGKIMEAPHNELVLFIYHCGSLLLMSYFSSQKFSRRLKRLFVFFPFSSLCFILKQSSRQPRRQQGKNQQRRILAPLPAPGVFEG